MISNKTTEIMVKLADKLSTAESEQNRILSLHREISDVRNNLVFISASLNRLSLCNDPEAPEAIGAIRFDIAKLLESI